MCIQGEGRDNAQSDVEETASFPSRHLLEGIDESHDTDAARALICFLL